MKQREQIAAKGAKPIRRMDEEEIAKLARDIYTGRVFFAVESKDVNPAFGGILAMLGGSLSKEFVDSVGAVWEYMEKAGPVAVNGRPAFLSCRFTNKEDVPAVLAQLRILVDTLGEPGA